MIDGVCILEESSVRGSSSGSEVQEMRRRPHRAKAAEWRDRLARFRDSGETVARFCEEENVSTASFYQWRRRFGSTPVATPQGVFQSVAVTTAGPVRIEFSGIRIEVPASDLAVVRAVVGEVVRAGLAKGDAPC